MYQNQQVSKFILVSIIPHNVSEDESFLNIRELISLVETYGGEVADIVLQKREVHDKGMYIGSGKIAEVSELIAEKEINIVVLNAIVVPGQLYELKNIFDKVNRDIEVWDRVDLILKIFAKQANTSEARMQIELAAMHHMGPRIYGMGIEMSRQGGGIGTRGIGETNTERMKRHWRNQIKDRKDKLKILEDKRKSQIFHRKDIGLRSASIVGYTNAGKTSLFNLLTGKKKLVKNALFATLDSATGKLVVDTTETNILLSDTIGFIRDLPPQLIEAFESTLMESIYADLILHVIDMTDSDMDRKIEVVTATLKDLKADQKPILYIFNKVDQASELQKKRIAKEFARTPHVVISTHTGVGVHQLISTVIDMLGSLQTSAVV
jgi:GTPase